MSIRPFAVFGILLLAQHAAAYNLETSLGGKQTRFADPEVVFSVDLSSFPDTAAFDAMGQAQSAFNKNPSNVRYKLTAATESVVKPGQPGANGNGRNDIHAMQFSSTGWTVRAFRVTDGATGNIKECDIIVNLSPTSTPLSFIPDSRTYIAFGGTSRFFQEDLLREFARCAGLNDEYDVHNLMLSPFVYRYEFSMTAYVGEDASNGLEALYGLYSEKKKKKLKKPQDLSISGLKRVQDGFRSVVSHVAVTNSPGGAPVPFEMIPEAALPKYYVTKGTPFYVEFTLENNGRAKQKAVSTAYYIALSTRPRKGEYLALGTANVGFKREGPETVSVKLKVPAKVPAGQYVILAVIDAKKEIKEFNESNNIQHVIVQVTD